MPVKPVDSIITREIEGELVIYDPNRDAVHTLNPTAQFIWEHISLQPEQMAEILQTIYRVSKKVAQSDVDHILDQFRTLGLIQAAPPQ